MKELSIEEKAKRYDELKVTAQELEQDDCFDKITLFDLFPELKESEDEKIRKSLIETLNGMHSATFPLRGFSREQYIAWLELHKARVIYQQPNPIGEDNDGNLVYADNEKHGEQKPTKRVEPKFKIGDLITNGILVGKIDETHEWGYHAYFEGHYADVPDAENWHKWTIQDAKDGDVLEFGDHGRLIVGIVSYVNKTTGKVDVNCLLENNNFKVGNYYNLDTIKPHPSTKEQRDLLFKKMHDAGYEWDAEKLELKQTKDVFPLTEDRKMLESIINDVKQRADLESEQIDWLVSLREKFDWVSQVE